MKKLMLVASLCVAALVLAPMTSANAERAAGRCTIEGSATFSPTNLKPVPTAKLGYEFHGSAECETLPSTEIRRGTVEAKGGETLSCAGSISEGEGRGTLTLGTISFPFGLTFLSGGPGFTVIVAKFGDGGVAVGTATFLGSKSEPASECFALRGAHELEFKAVAVGEL
jgi:hypothetical protein